MDQDYCQNDLSIANILNMNVYPDGDVKNENPVPVTIDTIVKYNYGNAENSFAQDTTADNDTLIASAKAPTFSSGTCDNFALEVHLKVLFSNRNPVDATDATNTENKDACACREVTTDKFTNEQAG